jgi:hypothetical protein
MYSSTHGTDDGNVENNNQHDREASGQVQCTAVMADGEGDRAIVQESSDEHERQSLLWYSTTTSVPVAPWLMSTNI